MVLLRIGVLLWIMVLLSITSGTIEYSCTNEYSGTVVYSGIIEHSDTIEYSGCNKLIPVSTLAVNKTQTSVYCGYNNRVRSGHGKSWK